jgi:hypothetical protein
LDQPSRLGAAAAIVIGMPPNEEGTLQRAEDRLRDASPGLAHLAARVLRQQHPECSRSPSRDRALAADFEDHLRVLATLDSRELTEHALLCIALNEAEGLPDWTVEEDFRAMSAVIKENLPQTMSDQLCDSLWYALDRARRG